MSPLFYITDNAVRSTVRPAFPIRKIRSTVRPAFPLRKKRLFLHQPSRWQTRCNTRPDFSSAPLSASRKIRSTVRPAFPIRKKTAFPPSTRYDSHKPLQYPSRLLFRASLRKPKNPVDSSPRFSSPKKNGFPAINRHGGKPVAIPVPTSPPCLSPQAAKSG